CCSGSRRFHPRLGIHRHRCPFLGLRNRRLFRLTYWAIYSNVAGAPGAVLFSGLQSAVTRVNTATGVLGIFDEFQNDFSIGSVALAAGTYWLALHNGPLTNTGGAKIYWETTSSLTGNPSLHQFLP